MLALALALPGPAAAAEAPTVPTPAIGAKAPDFDLPGVDGQRYTLASFATAKVLVVVFTATTARPRRPTRSGSRSSTPTSRAAASARPRLAERPPRAAARRAGLDGPRRHARRHEDPGQGSGWNFPYLYDGETEAMSRQYGPVATPHVFVFDAERKLRYVGRIDDNENPAKATTHDARDAIEAVLAGQARPGRDDQGLRLLGEVVRQAGLGEGGLREVGAGARRPSSRSTRRG